MEAVAVRRGRRVEGRSSHTLRRRMVAASLELMPEGFFRWFLVFIFKIIVLTMYEATEAVTAITGVKIASRCDFGGHGQRLVARLDLTQRREGARGTEGVASNLRPPIRNWVSRR